MRNTHSVSIVCAPPHAPEKATKSRMDTQRRDFLPKISLNFAKTTRNPTYSLALKVEAKGF